MRLLLATTLASIYWLDANGQSVGSTSSYGCVGSTTIFYYISTPTCHVTNSSAWSSGSSIGSNSGVAIQTNSSPVYYEQFHVTWTTPGIYNIGVYQSCGGAVGYPGSFTVYPATTPANAGPDQTDLATCGSSSVLVTGNIPTVGTIGGWSIISGYVANQGIGFGAQNSQFNSRTQTASVASTYFFGNPGSTYTLRYFINNTTCAATYDDMVVTFNQRASAGYIPACGNTTVNIAAGPAGESGAWSIVSGSGTIGNINSRNTTFQGTIGTSNVLKWTQTSGVCVGTSSNVNVTLYPTPTQQPFSLDKNSIELNESVTLSLSPFISQQTDTVNWGDGSPKQFVGVSPITHTYTKAGNFLVSLKTQQIGTPCSLITYKTVGVTNCPDLIGLDITSEPYLCATKLSVPVIKDCSATYSWNFGDGTTPTNRTKRNPFHAYANSGQFNVSVTIDYSCATLNCARDTTLYKQINIPTASYTTEPLIIPIVTDQRLEVINSTTSSFSDAWPLQYEALAIADKIGYWNGTAGVWRNDAAYAYEVPRAQSETVNIKQDGTYTMAQFNWDKAELNAIPNWIKANAITEYSPYGFELENKDVLGVFSAAVYDYNGQLPVANGVNMKSKELAFTSFETRGVAKGYATGNWLFGTQPPPLYETFIINSGSANMAVVEVPKQKLISYQNADVYSRSLTQSNLNLANNSTYIRANQIVCSTPHPQNNKWSMVVFEQAPVEPLWMGKMTVKNVFTNPVSFDIDSTRGHTGMRSLRVSGSPKTYAQQILTLDSGKTYRIGAWVTVTGANQLSLPNLGTNLGFTVKVKRKNGTTVSQVDINPSGPVIEGWQQVVDDFLCPINNALLEVTFKQGTSAAWYDDLRLHPKNGNMKSYVYDTQDFRLRAILDEENFASFFYYDAEGNLYLTKKETVDGIKTLTENISYQIER